MDREVTTTAPGRQATEDVACVRTLISNVALVGRPGRADEPWVLVDAGMPGTARHIVKAAEARFGAGARPTAIVLTHGHFDHVGALEALLERWDVPVYAHELELPYLTGRSSYPPPDPVVGGGAMALLSPLYPRGPIDIGGRVRALPVDGSVPGMPGWRWVHTPGHTPGHVSLFRNGDGALIAGDAFVTTDQESFLAQLTQREVVHRPPAYYTTDWRAAHASVEVLAALRPSVAVTGHGHPMRGIRLRQELERLSREFALRALPERGRYVREPAVADRTGVVYVPPAVAPALPKLLLGAAAVAVAGIAVASLVGKRND